MGGPAKRRLLIVDDEPDLRATLAQYFQSAGYAVDTAQDVPEALQKLPQRHDAILTDIRLPGTSGIHLLKEARVRNPQAGVFLITGFPSLDTVNAAKQYGAAAYFRKPLKLAEVEERLRAFLGDDQRSVIDGVLLVVGPRLAERLADRLLGSTSVVCEEQEAAFLQVVRQRRPKVVLADAASPATPGLLRTHQGLGREASCFILVSDEEALDATTEMVFQMGANACVRADTLREELEESIRSALESFEAQRMNAESSSKDLPARCEFAQPFRNGYHCQTSGTCPYGSYQGGWIALEGKEYRRCLKRPFLLENPDQVGFLSIVGRPDAAKCMECRSRLMALVRRGRTDLIVDAQGLTHPHQNLFEVFADVSAELANVHPEGVVSVINLSEALLDTFKRAMPYKGVRCYGPRMLDTRDTFARWGSRFN